MKILFVHQNFPGQYKYLAPALAQRGHDVFALADASCIENKPDIPGIKRLGYAFPKPGSEQTHPYIRYFEGQIRRGQKVARALIKLKQNNILPDIILGHPGWGEILYVKDILPNVPLIGLFEFYYHSQGHDVGFDPEFSLGENMQYDQLSIVRTKNVNNLLALEAVDLGICPTEYQKSVHPVEFHPKLSVIHDGIDTAIAKPDPQARIILETDKGQIILTQKDEVISFVNRNLEPYRGYHIFMRALPQLLKQRPQANVVVVGGNGVSYGSSPPGDQSWKAIFHDEVKDQIDGDRVHFYDRLPYGQLIRLFQVASVHVYLTYPFVLSWSMLEAMSCGCLVIGSKTPPVEEVIEHGRNGLLCDFFDIDEICQRVNQVFEHPDRMRSLREQARNTILEKYDLERVCLPQQITFVEDILLAKR